MVNVFIQPTNTVKCSIYWINYYSDITIEQKIINNYLDVGELQCLTV